MIGRRICHGVLLPLCVALAACTPAEPFETATRAGAAISTGSLPPMKSFSTPRPQRPLKANNDIALDFIQLSFQMESGRSLPVLSRFEGPISLSLVGAPTATLQADLTRLLARLRSETRIDIRQINSGDANIAVHSVPRAEIRRALPQAACFVVPNVGSLGEYRKARRTSQTDWTRITTRKRIAIFLPNDSSPQEIRDCLHEELAQALGPLNDLYRLPDSVFNDDNIHTVLTGYDMLILRAYYDPALRTGMSRGDVAQRLPAILARLNPAGEGPSVALISRTPRAWTSAIQTALGSGAKPKARNQAADQAVTIATRMKWQGNRRAFSHFVKGRLLQPQDPSAAQAQYILADRYYSLSPDTRLHRAYVGSQLAAYALRQGRTDDALAIIARNLDAARASENAALLATLMLLQSEALKAQNRTPESQAVRLDSLGWARYGFGPDWAVRAKMREVASLAPR